MSILPIGSLLSAAGAAGVAGPAASGAVAAPAATGAASIPAAPSGFGDVMSKALDAVSGLQSNADGLAVKAATGDAANLHDVTIAATEAQLATSLTVAIRDKAVAAFNSIMQMPL